MDQIPLQASAVQYPATMERLDRWSVWKMATRKKDGSRYKLPLHIDTGSGASSVDPDAWGSFDDACILYGHPTRQSNGLAFALFEDDDIVCFDFDDFSGKTRAQQSAILAMCKLSYAEVSQSGNGVHVFFRGHDARILRKRFDWMGMQLEIYRDKRFIALTGLRVKGSPPDLKKYSPAKVEKCLGELPSVARENVEAAVDGFEDEAPTISTKKLLKTIQAEKKFDKDARFVWSVLRDGGSNNSDEDYVFAKTLFRFGAVYSQALEIILSHNLRTDDKWDRADYQAATLSRAKASSHKEQVDRLAGFDDLSPQKVAKKAARDAFAELSKRNAKMVKRLEMLLDDLNEAVAMHNQAVMMMQPDRADVEGKRCNKLARKINRLDVARLNKMTGEIHTDKKIRYVMYHADGVRRYAKRDLEDAMLSQNFHASLTVMAKGILKLRVGRSSDTWLTSPDKLVFPRSPVMKPSPKIHATDAGFGEDSGKKPYNLFQGVTFEPIDTGVSAQPIYDHILDVWSCGDQDTADYILNWLARMVQKPHLPAETAIALKSIQGVGKSKITDIFGKYYGRHFLDTTDIQDLSGFNEMAVSSVMVVMNEATFGGSKRDEGVLKKFITDKTLVSQGKFEDKMTVNNCVHMMVLTNNSWAVPVGLDDRRFVVLECSDHHMDARRGGGTTREAQAAYFDKLIDNCIDAGGDVTFLHELLQRDIKGFDPRKRPAKSFENDARREQEYRGLDLFQRWFLSCVEEGGFSVGGEVLIDWPDSEPLTVSVSDVKFAFQNSRMASTRAGDVPFKIASELSRLFLPVNAKIGSATNVHSKLIGSKNKGRGIVLPPRDDVCDHPAFAD